MPVLSREVEVELARRWRDTGDREAHDLLMMSQKADVLYTAKKYRTNNIDLEDLIQAGWLGVARALLSFDPDQGFRLHTYSTHWIWNYITEASNLARRHATMTISLESSVGSQRNENLTLSDVLPTDGKEAIRAEHLLAFDACIKTWMKLLRKRERYIIRRRYLGRKLRTLEQIGKELGVTRERARQIEKRALSKMRKCAATTDGKLL